MSSSTQGSLVDVSFTLLTKPLNEVDGISLKTHLSQTMQDRLLFSNISIANGTLNSQNNFNATITGNV